MTTIAVRLSDHADAGIRISRGRDGRVIVENIGRFDGKLRCLRDPFLPVFDTEDAARAAANKSWAAQGL